MQITVVFLGLLCVACSRADMMKKSEEQKEKREAPIRYGSAHSTHTLQLQPSSLGHKDASAISIGAGYSVGGAKPSFSYEPQPQPGHSYQLAPSAGGDQRATIQLAPITLQPDGGHLVGSDLTQIMNQISEGLNSGAISLQSLGAGYQGGQQQQAAPQFLYGAPKLQQYSVNEQSQGAAPSYAAGTKGLGSYSTGPVLFNPESQMQQNYAPSHALGDATHTFASFSGASAQSLGAPSFAGVGHSLGGQSLGGYSFGAPSIGSQSFGAHSLGGASHGGPGQSFGGPGQSFGGAYKSFASHAPPNRAFKPSAYLGSVGDSSHTSSGISLSHGPQTLGHSMPPSHGYALGSGYSGLSLSSGGHVPSFGGQAASFDGSLGGYGGGSSKFVSPSYLPPKPEGFGSFESISAAFGGNHLSSPPGTTYGSPSGSYSAGPSSSGHAAHSTPQYYISPSKHTSSNSFGDGSAAFKAPTPSHSSLAAFSSGAKFGGGGHGASTRFSSPASKDSHGAYSESSYNTIKYSEELKPRAQA